jgi:DNA-binding transcriptional LysR family regulator
MASKVTPSAIGGGRSINLIEEGVDLAIRNGELANSSMVVRRIAMAPFATVATPTYLAVRGVPWTPADLDAHACLIFTPNHEPLSWEFREGSVSILHHPRANFRTADAEQIRAAVLADLGLAHGPLWAFSPEIAAGVLRVVLADYAPGPLAISAVHPAGRRLPTKVRVFIDFLVEILASDPALTGQLG